MKLIAGLCIAGILLMGCSNTDDAGEENTVTDTRYKLVFDHDGTGTIIGDSSNKVLKTFDIEQPVYPIGFFMEEQSDELIIATRDINNATYFVSKITPIDILHSEAYTIPLIPLFNVPFDPEDTFASFQFISGSDYFLLLSTDTGLVYKRYTGENLIETKNFSQEFSISLTSSAGIAYSKDRNELILLHENHPDNFPRIHKFNLDSWSYTISDSFFPPSLFGSFSNAEDTYLIGRRTMNFEGVESIYNSNGDMLTETYDTSNFVAQSAIGYDETEERFEYVHKSDGRKEVGVINLQTGLLEKSVIEGEPGRPFFPLIFFND